MFWVTMAGIFPALYSEASARCPRPGRAAAKVGSIAKRRRHASSLASRLAMNSSNGIGRLRVHNPPGERKSGIPHSVEMPAPVKGTMVEASAIMSPSCSTPLRRSGAIMGIIRSWAAPNIARPVGLHLRRLLDPPVALVGAISRRFRDRFRHRVVLLFIALLFIALLFVALLRLCDRSRGRRFFRRLAVLRQSFHFSFQLGLPRRDLFRQLLDRSVAQRGEFFDA